MDRVYKIALGIAWLDFTICLVAFAIQNIFEYPDKYYFMSVELSRSLRIIVFALGFMVILGYEDNLSISKENNHIIKKLYIFLVAIYIADFYKIVFAYHKVIIWKELFYIKRVFHFGVLIYIYLKARKLIKNHNFIYN